MSSSFIKLKLLISSLIISLCSLAQSTHQPYNVLFIMVDDLRPELGCYGSPQVLSPNIDQLAKESVTFSRAYCNIPVCGASRASLLSGILPLPNRFVQYDAYTQEDTPNAITLPQAFRKAGYRTISVGKVFHHKDDCEEKSWSNGAWLSGGDAHDSRPSLDPETNKVLSAKGRGRIYELPDVDDAAYPDGKTALETIRLLKELKDTDQPFFLATGFYKPHLPFYAPKRYWDLYDRDSIDIADNRYKPINAPLALHGSGEFKNYYLDSMPIKSEQFHRMMKHGYLACVSYTDKLIGDVLTQLKNVGLDKNTIVVLWGDHGWHLGEHNYWGKHNTMHWSMQVPLMMKLPGVSMAGAVSDAIVESVDIYPTLCDIAGITPPLNQLQGKSFSTLLSHPYQDFKPYAYCRFLAADAIVTPTYTYTEYSGKKPGVMLYDLTNDKEENTNIAGNPENTEVLEKMKAMLTEAKQKALMYP